MQLFTFGINHQTAPLAVREQVAFNADGMENALRDQAVKPPSRGAGGLDSWVLGEPQILGQMKQAVRQAEQAGTLGFLLHKLFQRTFSVAKDVRTQTEIGANLVSMAAAAVRLAGRIFPSLSEPRGLFVR